MEDWTPYATIYTPLEAGSCDRSHTAPHDRAVLRATKSNYRPNKGIRGDPQKTLFIGRLNMDTTEEKLRSSFEEYGTIKNLRLVRDIVSGYSRGYAFVEFKHQQSAKTAHRLAHKTMIDNCEILVEFEKERVLPGWIPRRFGGGFGGKKEAGQLRFGGRDRPFRKPPEVLLQERLQRERPKSSMSGWRAQPKHDERERDGRSRSRYSPSRRRDYDDRSERLPLREDRRHHDRNHDDRLDVSDGDRDQRRHERHDDYEDYTRRRRGKHDVGGAKGVELHDNVSRDETDDGNQSEKKKRRKDRKEHKHHQKDHKHKHKHKKKHKSSGQAD